MKKLQDPAVSNQIKVDLLQRFVENPSSVLTPEKAEVQERKTRKKDMIA